MSTKSYVLILGLMGVIMAVRLIFYYSNPDTTADGQRMEFETRLSEVPQLKNGRQQFRVKNSQGGRINITTGLSPLYEYGNKIVISGDLKTIVYKGHTFFTMNFPSIQTINNDQNFIAGAATGIRNNANKLYGKSLPPISSSLMSGIIFGGNQGLPKIFMEDLQTSGAVHVIAASGMNVTFVASALIGVLGAFLKRQTAITIAVFGVLFYAFISGFEPSITRASIMAVIAFSASLLGRQNFALASLMITAFVMLVFSPLLLTDVGFQLSFLATLGILLIKPGLEPGFKRFGLLSKMLGDDLGTTIAAQLATIPILMAVFGDYGMLSVLINALILWTVPILMVIGTVGLILGWIFEPLGQIVLALSIPILYYFENVVRYFGNLGWVLEIPKVSVFVWAGYYLLLTSGILLINQNRSKNKLKRENTP